MKIRFISNSLQSLSIIKFSLNEETLALICYCQIHLLKFHSHLEKRLILHIQSI